MLHPCPHQRQPVDRRVLRLSFIRNLLPRAHQLFLEKAFEVSEDGTIGAEIEGTRGVIVYCTAIQLIQLLSGSEPEGDGSDE